MKVPTAQTEARLDELRRTAQPRTTDNGQRPTDHGQPHTYHDLPLLKPPVWTWEIPLYFFVGGAAGASSVLAAVAQVTGADKSLVRDARRIAALGAALSAPLLISDLGRPERFLMMLRVFKVQSAMSVGAWTVAAFGAATTATAVADAMKWRFLASSTGFISAAGGLVMATYTGVLLGVTAIPLWYEHARLLPAHFGASALGSACSLLELRGHDEKALNVLALGAAMFESWTAVDVELHKNRHSDALRSGTTGALTRVGAVLSGPVPLALRILGFGSKRARQAAAVSSLLGSLVTRFAWVEAGKRSARDVALANGLQRA